jgi:hypothetical protein
VAKHRLLDAKRQMRSTGCWTPAEVMATVLRWKVEAFGTTRHRLLDARRRSPWAPSEDGLSTYRGPHWWYNVIGPTGEMLTVAPGSPSMSFVAKVCPR